MKEDIVYKLKALQSVEADREWKETNKKRMMEDLPSFGVQNNVFVSSNDVFAAKSKFDLKAIFASHLAVSLTSLMVVLSSGVITVGASQSSLPGETLYPIKKASEQVALAVASEEDKPKVEIEQAGKRLEELAAVTQKSSDVDQHKKVEQLVNEFEDKVNSANQRLNTLKDKSENDEETKQRVVSIAEVVNEQSEKYSEVLEKTAESMPDSVKDKVAVSVENAVKTTEKTNIEALLVIVETKEETDDVETEKTKVQKKLEKAEKRLGVVREDLLSENVCLVEDEEVEEVEGETQMTSETLEEDTDNEENEDFELLSAVEEETCISSEDFDFRKQMILDTQSDIFEAKKKIEEKKLVEALNVLTAVSGEIDKFEDGEFAQEEEAQQEENIENEEGDNVETGDGEDGSVEGVNTEKEEKQEEKVENNEENQEEVKNAGDENVSEDQQEEATDSEKVEESE